MHSSASTVSGLGFGVMAAVLQTCNMLDIMSGPAMVPARGCGNQNLFIISCTLWAIYGC